MGIKVNNKFKVCISNPALVTPLNLAFLLAYHVQSLNELEALYESTEGLYICFLSIIITHKPIDDVGTLHSLYCMTFQDLGRYAVASSLAMAMALPLRERVSSIPITSLPSQQNCIIS